MGFLLSDKGFRNAVLSIAIKTIKLRYKNSLLGVFWSMLNPIIFLLILWAVFREVSNMENYALYALSGLVFWNFLSASILQVLTSFIDNASILKSINLHPLSFPLAAGLAALFNLMLTLIPFFALMFMLGYKLDLISLLFVFPMILISGIFVVGLGMFLGSINVYFRDVQLLWNTIMPAFFYFTPIAYSIDLVPENSRYLLKFNPFYYFIDAFHQIFYQSMMPSSTNLIMCLLLSFSFFIFGYFVFKRYKKGFISNI